MAETARNNCRRNSWLAALAGGALVALMLVFLAHYGPLRALVIGLIVCLVLGVFLVWAFCTQAAIATENEATPAPRPAPEASPAPRPEVAPEATPTPEARTAPAAMAAPPAFVSAQPGSRPAVAPESEAASDAAAEMPGRRRGSAAGLDAALAKSKDEPPAPAPGMLAAPRGGGADDLKLIRGIGPKLEALLNEVGVWHFDQIAAWKAKDIAHVDERLVGFRGRITRDEWVKQARALAAGGGAGVAARARKGAAQRGEG